MTDDYLSKLEPGLEHALSRWQSQAGTEAGTAEDSLIPVLVTYQGDIADLRAAGLETGYDSGTMVSGRITFEDMERLAAVPAVVLIDLQPVDRPLLDNSVAEMRVPWKVPPGGGSPGRGSGVIVAVIDTGIDIFHESFRKSDGTTRILEMWDQDPAASGGSGPPAGMLQQGRVYSTQQINDGITAGPPFGSVDTDGHGTHVAGIAAGNGGQDDRCSFPGRYVGVAPLADLVIVKAISLPGTATPDINDAIAWCTQAGTRHANKPVVINCSFGSDTGAHDGTSSRNRFIDGLLNPGGSAVTGLSIVCAAGNEGNKDMHDSGTVPQNGASSVSFYIPSGSDKPDILDIWYNGTATLDVTLTAPANPNQPGTNTTGTVSPGAAGSPFPIGLMSVKVTSSTAPLSTNNKKNIRITIRVNTTPDNLVIRPGVWQITLTETSGTAANWDAWFATSNDYSPTFRLPTDTGDLVDRRRNNTVGDPGNTRSVITVANYSDEDDDEITASSSRGIFPVPSGIPVGEVKPTVAAPGTGVAAPRSRDEKDTPSSCCDQKVIDKTGTSMSSPHVAGVVALMLEKNRTLSYEAIRAHLQHSARIDGIPAAEVPTVLGTLLDATLLDIRAGHIWGSGKVNAAVALAEMPSLGGGGGGGGGGPTISLDDGDWGYTPHTIFSRLGDWRNKFGPRPGLMLVAALISKHFDEVLRLINHNRRVGAVWQRQGGPLLVRYLLHGQHSSTTLLPAAVDGCDVTALLAHFLPIINRFSSARLSTDIERYQGFVQGWPGAELQDLDTRALQQAGRT